MEGDAAVEVQVAQLRRLSTACAQQIASFRRKLETI
jgi:hypothetical protein